MQFTKPLLTAAALSTFVAGIAMMAPAAHAEKAVFEKCSGIVKAGKNDCKSSAHSCAGQASKDASPTEWLYVPAGTCDKIVGGHVVKM